MEGPLCDTALTGSTLRDLLLASSANFFSDKLQQKNGSTNRRTLGIVDAKIIGEGSGMTSKVLRVHLQWSGDDDDNSSSAQESSQLSRSCIVKVIGSTAMKAALPDAVSESVTDSIIGALSHAHDIECRIYELEGLNMAVPMVRCYAKSRSLGPESPGIIALEDLSDRAKPTSFINFGMPFPPSQLDQLIQVLASLHAWSVNQEAWKHTILTMQETRVALPFYASLTAMFPACKATFPEQFEKLDEARMNEYFSADKFMQIFGSDPKVRYNLPTVLVHGDIHPMNMLFEKKNGNGDGHDDDDGKLLALIDWQIAHQGCAMEDMTRVMIMCVPNQTERVRDEILVKYLEMYNKKVDNPENRVTFEDCKKPLDEMFAFTSVMWSFTSMMTENIAREMFKEAPEEEREAFKNRLLQLNFNHLKEAIKAYGW